MFSGNMSRSTPTTQGGDAREGWSVGTHCSGE
jgi:hypothetical protein